MGPNSEAATTTVAAMNFRTMTDDDRDRVRDAVRRALDEHRQNPTILARLRLDLAGAHPTTRAVIEQVPIEHWPTVRAFLIVEDSTPWNECAAVAELLAESDVDLAPTWRLVAEWCRSAPYGPAR